MLLVGFLPPLVFSFGIPANAASHNGNGLNLLPQTQAECQQLVIVERALHILNSHFEVEESAEEDLNDNFNTTFTGYENHNYYSILRSGLNTRLSTPLHLVRYYILYCCPKIPSFHS